MKKSKQPQSKSKSPIDAIHDQMENNPHYPHNIMSGWMPHPGSPGLAKFVHKVMTTEPTTYATSIQALDDFISGNDIIGYLVDDACQSNGNIFASPWESESIADKAAGDPSGDGPWENPDYTPVPRFSSKEDLLNALNAAMNEAPQFIDNDLVGLPFSAIVVGIDPTQSGMTLFRLPQFNEKMKAVLDEWHTFLASTASNTIFSVEGENWLSAKAKKHYQFEVWEKDNQTLPYWNSWDSFFTRTFKNIEESRPIAEASNNKIVVSANDGSRLCSRQ